MKLFYNLLTAVDANKEVSSFATDVIPVLKIVVAVIIALCALFMVIAIVAHKGNSNGISGVTGSADTFYNRNKGASLQGKIKKWTVIDAIVLFVLCIVFLVLNLVYAGY